MRHVRHVFLACGAAAVLIAATPAVAAAPVAPALKGTLAKLKTRTTLPILLPATLPVFREGKKPLYPTVSADAKTYDVTLGLVPDCGANVCSAGYLYAVRTPKLPSVIDGKYTVKLHGRTGRYAPFACGASCSPPSISFRSAGVNYSFSLKLDITRPDTDRSVLTRLANEALDAGPR